MNYFCVFDLETDSIDTNFCCPTQVACQMINPYNLQVIEGSQFYSKMRPIDMDAPGYLDAEREKTIAFHCRNRNLTKAELLKEWDESPHTSIVWKQFSNHINKYNKQDKDYSAPFAAGMNIINFDLPITNRLNTRFGINKMFGYKHVFDLRHMLTYWLMWENTLKSHSLDSMRSYMGIDGTNAHDALKDVQDTTDILLKFLRLHKNLFEKIKFKNCFQQEAVC